MPLAIPASGHAHSHDELSCYHCGLDVPAHTNYRLSIKGIEQPMCCLGCLAAADFIQQNGMGDFYQHRGNQLPESAVSGQYGDRKSWEYYDQPEVRLQYQKEQDGETCARIYVQGMYCSSCAWLIDSSLSQLPGVERVQLNPDTHQVQLFWKPEQSRLSDILSTISKLGYQPRPLNESETGVDKREFENRQSLKRLAVAGFGMMQVMTYAIGVYLGDYQGMDEGIRQFLNLVSLLVATVVVFYSGAPFFKHAWFDLKNRHLGMDVPVALAIGGAYSASLWQVLIDHTLGAEVYFDSAVMFVFFLSLGRFLEMRARYSAASSADALRQLLPPLVTVWRNGESLVISPQQLEKSDEVDVLAGETIPCDGRVLNGEAQLDESLLTGEARAVACAKDSLVTGGTKLQSGRLRLVVTQAWEQSAVASIKQLLDRAQSQRPQRVRLADAMARYFVAGLLVLAFAVGLFWYIVAPDRVFGIVLSVLIASCPCAFSLATPAVLTVASHFLSRHGVLLSNADACESLLSVNHWCFDKTGTLSTAELVVEHAELFADMPEADCLAVIGAIERQTDHVLASAFSSNNTLQATDVQVVHGSGVYGQVSGKQYFIGNPSWIEAQCSIANMPSLQDQHSVILLAEAGKLLAAVYLSDKIRRDAAPVLQSLKQQGDQISILSGDRQGVVSRFAQSLPVDKALGDLLPADKVAYLRELQAQGQHVAMIGDGVNDAPVLGQANVSIAMASGSQLSQSQADVILLGGRLQGLGIAQQVAKRAQYIIRQNLTWAILYNLTVLPLAATGVLAPWMAAIGMSLSSLAVVVNARRLNRLTF
ncbi:heavy metal translocating P-type ATPase [Leucothrix mucor]|uniref:heavy metal translocating P-type ATPase n=1 Tax=Leucothrix mucor TaxID=45248 RepID=UPI0003B5508A|nr:heavy metal translocating P-type ATPase [Leucothrix mucor]